MTAPTTQAEQEDAVREALTLACDDPGHFVGFKGERSLGQWQADALLAGPIADLKAQRDRELRWVEFYEKAQADANRLVTYMNRRLRALEAAEAERDQLAADLRKAREEVDRLTDLADAAAFHFFCCNDGIHRDDECGQLVPAMADLAKAIDFYNDPATDEEIAAVPVSSAAARAALTPDPNDAGGTAKGEDHA